MDFKQALAWRGIDTARPVTMPRIGYVWYGFLRDNALGFVFDGFVLGMTKSFSPEDVIRILRNERFGYRISTEPDYGLLEKMQDVNPFVGTTHYPEMCYQMENISRLKYIWVIFKKLCSVFWGALRLIKKPR